MRSAPDVLLCGQHVEFFINKGVLGLSKEVKHVIVEAESEHVTAHNSATLHSLCDKLQVPVCPPTMVDVCGLVQIYYTLEVASLSVSLCVSVFLSSCLSLSLSVFYSLSVSVCLLVSLCFLVSISLSVWLSGCLSLSVSLCVSGCLSLCISLSLSGCLYGCLFVWLFLFFVSLSLWLYLCLSDWLSLCVYIYYNFQTKTY